MSKSFDLIAIGDVVSDAFIRIRDASVNCDLNTEHCLLSFRFGDKIPYEFVEVVRAVGNSANAVVSASRLGLKTAFISDIGSDENGEGCLEELKQNAVDTTYITTHSGRETNYHYVLWYEDERTILVKHQEYEYVLPQFETPKWIYLSSLAENSLPYQEEIAEYLKGHPEVKLVFQPGTFQIRLGYKKLQELYSLSYLFFCNVDEAKRILSLTEEIEIFPLLKKMRELGPKIMVITDGRKGAYVYDGETAWFMPTYPDPKPAYERTGAGDAFASTFTSAMILGKTIPEALSWAPINSMSVVQEIGAQKGLLTRETLENYLKIAPPDYAPRKIS
ncbi:MAG: carbohydrate kinase family protein [Patescibacteria group bacterium]|nr:carbohydrate kinase family protein [bacterium]MDZ4240828.1 carbohydrate kinase family protein [Patescibacteria group bacterium]